MSGIDDPDKDPAAYIATLERKIELQNELLELGNSRPAQERRQELLTEIEQLKLRVKKLEADKAQANRRAKAAQATLQRVKKALAEAFKQRPIDVSKLQHALGSVVHIDESSGNGADRPRQGGR